MSAPTLEPTYRLPDPKTIPALLGGPMGSRDAATRLRKSIQKAWDRLKGPQQILVATDFGATVATFLHVDKTAGKPDATEISNFVKLLKAFETRGTPDLTIHPGYQGVRAANEAERKNLTTMISTLKTVIDKIVNATDYDVKVNNVFGAGYLDEVKAKFKDGFAALTQLAQEKKVVLDFMKKDIVWCAGGLTNPKQMALSPSVLQSASDDHAITLAHEMTHAIPNGRNTSDKYYSHHTEFKKVAAEDKLITAAYYEEVVRQILKKYDEQFVTSIPAKTTTAPDEVLGLYRERASKLVNAAWVTAIRLHGVMQEQGSAAEAEPQTKGYQFKSIFTTPDVISANNLALISNGSKLLGLTVHKRASVVTTTNPVTSLDLAIADNKISMLAALNGTIGKIVALPPKVTTFGEEYVDHVLNHSLLLLNKKTSPGLLSKNIDKDIIVIRSLAVLHESISGGTSGQVLLATLPKGLPEPMKTHVATHGTAAVHIT